MNKIITNVSEYIDYIKMLKILYSNQFNEIQQNSDAHFKNINTLKSIPKKLENEYNNFIEAKKSNKTKKKYFKTKINSDTSFFFRGQYNFNHGLISSIFRPNIKDSSEAEIMKSVLSERPAEFSSCNGMFEKLTIMQHYGIPTRIMDLTGNPLIALYFACEDVVKEPKENNCERNGITHTCPKTQATDGSVFLFAQNKKHLLDFNSDKVRLLSNISLISNFKFCYYDNKFDRICLFFIKICYLYLKECFAEICTIPEFSGNNQLNDQLKFYSDRINDVINNKLQQPSIASHSIYDIEMIYKSVNYYDKFVDLPYSGNLPKYTILHDLLTNFSIVNNYKSKELSSTVQSVFKEDQLESCRFCISKSNCKEKLLNILRDEKPHFEDRILKPELDNWYIVKSIKNNPRIQLQDGSFIICPEIKSISDIYSPFTINNKIFNQRSGTEIPIKFSSQTTGYKSSIKNNTQTFRFLYNKYIQNEPYIHKIKIPNIHKKDIIIELANMGINHSTIYPELHEFANYIKYKFMK